MPAALEGAMISERFKQRLVGIIVLAALAIVFVPVFFNLEPSVPIDETSQIPPAPEVEPVTIAEPEPPPVEYRVPDHEAAFRLDSDLAAQGGDAKTQPPTATQPAKAPQAQERVETPTKKAPEAAPALAATGLPESWVIQVASFREASAAEQLNVKLQNGGHKAFVRQGVSGGHAVHRVYVGPHVLRKNADEEKARIDAAYKVKSLVMRFEP